VTIPRLLRGSAARALGLAILGELVLLHFVLEADAERATLFGHALPMLCALRETLGLPCPTCGLTRAVGMSLHGELGDAWRLFPAAPLTLGWLTVFALALVGLGRRLADAPNQAARTLLTRAALGLSGISVIVWLVDYATRIAQATHGAS
jgi:hypothetical protein